MGRRSPGDLMSSTTHPTSTSERPRPEPPTPSDDPIKLRPALRRGRNAGLPWILPALIVSVGVLYYCIAYTGYISTLKWDGASPRKTFVGAANYTKMVADPVFWKSLSHTLVFFV